MIKSIVVGVASLAGLTAVATRVEAGGCYFVLHTVYTNSDWTYDTGSPTLKDAQREANTWKALGAKVAGIHNRCTGKWESGGPPAASPPKNELWYRSTLYERYLYRDRYGRYYWSGWQSAGTFQNPSRTVVENYVRGWLQGDPYKNASGQSLSRGATAIEGFYR